MTTIKKVLIVSTLFLQGCLGYEVTNADLIGQIKKIGHYNPIFCPGYDFVDVSLGVFRNGIGSASKEDVPLTIMLDTQRFKLQQIFQKGKLVKITYDKMRLAICTEERLIVDIEEVD